jgi:hypothetical protein
MIRVTSEVCEAAFSNPDRDVSETRLRFTLQSLNEGDRNISASERVPANRPWPLADC